jgi:branched-chain amino acid transport system ATP-binding protein
LVSSEALLEVRDISVYYGAFRALENISYTVGPGKIVCLLGGNASGKSSSMKAIFGTVPLRAGSIYFDGQRIEGWSTAKRVAAGIAAVPEGRRVFANLTVRENLQLGACTRKDAHAIRGDLDNIMDQFPVLRDRQDQLAGSMSGGEQQMLAFGRALMSRPKLICMDEPSMGLSPLMVSRNFQLIESIRDRGTAVFVVEQNARAALKIADYAYVLRTGSLMLQGSSAQVAADPQMQAAYLGHATGTSAPPPGD